MKSISIKLFFALLGLTSLVLIATLFLARWSFDQGFLDYVNSQQQRRLERVAQDLSEYYLENGQQWDRDAVDVYMSAFNEWGARGDRGRRTESHRLPKLRADQDGGRRGGHSKHFRGEDGAPFKRPPPPNDGQLTKKDDVENHHQSGNDDLTASLDRRRLNRRGRPRLLDPVVLYDLSGRSIAGNPELLEGSQILKVDVVVNNKRIGELRSISRIDFSSTYESQFAGEQTKASIFVAILCLMIAGIASWLLSTMLLSPMLKMRTVIGSLAQGNYRQRVNVAREDELGRLMRDINCLAETLEKNQQTRKRWLADISHELRTPIAILSGEIEAMLDGIRPLDMSHIESLNHEVDRLKHLVDDLYQLSLSDIDGLRYDFLPLDISDLLGSVINQNRFRLNDASLSLDFTPLPDTFISGDSARLEQLFTNLINNTINYTDAPGSLTVRLSIDGSHVNLCFSDSAPGIAEDQLESVFEPLFRGEKSRTREAGGAGLGLTICQNIVKAHQGSIVVNNAPQGGLEFVIKLPLISKHK